MARCVPRVAAVICAVAERPRLALAAEQRPPPLAHVGHKAQARRARSGGRAGGHRRVRAVSIHQHSRPVKWPLGGKKLRGARHPSQLVVQTAPAPPRADQHQRQPAVRGGHAKVPRLRAHGYVGHVSEQRHGGGTCAKADTYRGRLLPPPPLRQRRSLAMVQLGHTQRRAGRGGAERGMPRGAVPRHRTGAEAALRRKGCKVACVVPVTAMQRQCSDNVTEGLQGRMLGTCRQREGGRGTDDIYTLAYWSGRRHWW